MAANNYFGFTHGGTQYSPQPATPYPAHQTTYVQPAQTAYATAAPRTAQAYETYPATHTTGQYAYTAAARPQNAAAPTIIPKATATYDTSKTYYAPAAAAAPAAATVYTVAETPYQTAKPAYSATAYPQQVQPRQAAAAKPAVAHSSAASYVYPAGSTTTVANPTSNAPSNSTGYTATTSASTYSGYDAALYSAATSYYQQQQAAKQGTNWQYTKAKTGTTTTGTTAAPKPKPKVAPKQPQLHYCEVCKISCAGPQTYREHLEGQKHKKKEAAAKSGTTTAPASRAVNQLRCELCDVACTGSDAYAAHIRGAKHQKVLKLHTKLGKPIPSAEPVVLPPTSPTVTPAKTTATTATPAAKPAAGKTTPATTTVTKKVVATPKITFVGQQSSNGVLGGSTKVKEEKESKTAEDYIAMQAEKDVIPVGQEYIEEMKNEGGKVVSFNCKLCECKFNDPNAKEMHMKGRRHRLQYKKKVDPSLMVEVRPSIRARKLQEEKLRRQAAKEEYWRRRDAEERWREEMRFMRMEEEHYFMGRGFGRGMPFHGPGMGPVRRPDTTDDRHVMAKHASIYPTEPELQAVQNIVSSCEKALKLVSDFIAESDAPKNANGAKVKAEVKQEKPAETKDGSSFADKKDGDSAPRALKGVMRVGVLAKGLLLHGDLNVQLVLLCSEKPTRTLLERVADNLPKQLATVAEDNIYEVKMCVEEAAVIVTGEKEPSTTCTITLTSPIMRDQDPPAEGGAAKHGEYAQDDLEKSEIESSSVTVKDPPDVLDRQKCLAALAALRHAKWFQARANGLQSCVVVIRILRDLCQRVPTWTPLQQWAMELLVEKCVSSGGTTMSPGDALRRVFECIASGILLPGGPGLYDPCEKEAQDAAGTLSAQEREDITASAQHALRLIAFRQIHKVLGMDALPVPRYTRRQGFNPRKRRRDNSAGEGEDDAGKKDKKEDEAGK